MGALPLRGAPTDLATSQRGTTYNYTYDTKGNATALEAKKPDGDMSLKSTAEYTSNGAFPAKTTDQEGIETTYNYDQNSGLLMSAQDSSTTTSYTYDENTNQLTSVTAEWDSYEDEYATNSYSYTAGTGRNLTQISHNGTNYNIEYDKFNNKTNSLVGNQSLAQYSYDSNNGILQSVTYGNGNTVSYAYDNYGNTTVQKYNGIEAFKWFSDRSGSVIRQSDFINQLETSYDYDTTGRLTRQTTLDTSKASSTDRTKYMVEYGYDLNNNITRLVNITPNGTKTFNYTYGKDNFLEKFTIGTNRSVDYTYDGLGRLTGSTITTARPIETSYSYKLSNRNSSGQTQYRTTKINNEIIDGEEYRYTYDNSGNITKIESVTVENGNRVGTTLYVYEYDSFGQLIFERDYIQNLSRHYDYDEGGNLLNETINYYDGSNGGVPTRTEDINYRYTDTNWTDKMTSYKGQTITYDEIGNPLTYRDGMTMTWQNGRQLASLQKGNNNIQYSYDSEGIRVSKTINGEKCTFEYLNGMLLYETRGEKYFHYYYDSNGMLCAVSYRLTSADDENIYYYTHNWRGDIVGIYTDAGDLTAKYTYDSWGNVTSIIDGNGNAITDQNHVGNLNPFRYRGYYMDTETGMYYLMSRYYDPVTHRFVNADGYFQTGLGILDGNMNVYCVNNPVMFTDPTGTCYWGVNGEWLHDNWEFSGGYKRQPKPTSENGSAKPYVKMQGSNNVNAPNCYAYAIGSQINEQPGSRSGRIPKNWNDVNDVGISVISDLKALGYTVRIISAPDEKVYTNEFKIALRVGTKPFGYSAVNGGPLYDYHFMRQTNTGQWAEKHGVGGDSIVWDSGMTPNNIPWTLGGKLYYDSQIIYYAVGE